MLIALFNNLPELVMGAAWTGLVFWWGRVVQRKWPDFSANPAKWWPFKKKV